MVAVSANGTRRGSKGSAMGTVTSLSGAPYRAAGPADELRKPASPSVTIAPQEPSPRSLENEVVFLARKYHIDRLEMHDMLEEFRRADTDHRGLLSKDQFKRLMSRRLGGDGDVPGGDPGCDPQRIIGVDTADSAHLASFEEFVSWWFTVQFSASGNALNAQGLDLRQVALKCNIDALEAERGWDIFHRHDANGDGRISRMEFAEVMCTMMKAKDPGDIPRERLDRFWKEADVHSHGSIGFEDFLAWVRKYTSSWEEHGIASAVYSRLGMRRTSTSASDL